MNGDAERQALLLVAGEAGLRQARSSPSNGLVKHKALPVSVLGSVTNDARNCSRCQRQISRTKIRPTAVSGAAFLARSESQFERNAEHPLVNGQVREDSIGEMRGGAAHAAS